VANEQQCPKCGLVFEPAARRCPRRKVVLCRSRAVRWVVGAVSLAVVLAGCAFLIWVWLEREDSRRKLEDFRQMDRGIKLRGAMIYLVHDPDYAWCEVYGDNVVVGFHKWRSDMDGVVGPAAVKGSQATGRRCSVWAVPYDQRGFRPGDHSYWTKATAKSGGAK
jgi:hypothetical protein